MLQNLSEEIRNCHRHAEDCRCKAEASHDPVARSDFLELESRWLLLARSYELAERLSTFTTSRRRQEQQEAARAPCPHCHEPMDIERTIPQLGGLPALIVFYCARCNHAETKEQQRDA
jgi:hypothetical protein